MLFEASATVPVVSGSEFVSTGLSSYLSQAASAKHIINAIKLIKSLFFI
ncbi:MAG: hypothetical protein IKH10_03550 [Bacteroidetes bacterium]|nr:hypothetical protein [Bacteroidota bacterium]